VSQTAAPEPVVVHHVRVEHRGTDVLLSCRVRDQRARLPPQLWFRLARDAAPFLEAAADPFLPALLLFCMKAGVPLIIEADVSAQLLSSVGPIQDIYLAWAGGGGHRLARIEVRANAAARRREGESSGAFFSCGVDSFYTLLRNVRRYPPADSRCIEKLFLVHGFDIPLEGRTLFEQVERHARGAAEHFGKHLITVETNVRAATTTVEWGHYGHGAALASVGLALGGMVHTVFIPSTLELIDLMPWGSHPALDPLWSTEQVEFVHDGGEARRDEKIRFIASFPSALDSLRVCWENRGGAYNCGQCEKCLRTMADLEVAGALSRAAMFPDRIDLRAIENLVVPESVRAHWLATLEAARNSVKHHELITAIQEALKNGQRHRHRWWHRVLPAFPALRTGAATGSRNRL
jgi:hypothetical protein